DAGAWPWVAVGLLGGSVAVERVLAGRHFYTDVIAGAAAGTAFGIAIPLLHRRGPWAPRLAAVPVRGGVALTLTGRR
ncbi:MAG: phosphatase PAP2 family protein, partial [Syntrophomonadaceae bacterium]